MLELTIQRKPTRDGATLGELSVDGAFFCHTLEDPVREFGPNGEGKVYGDTAIPAGRYRVAIDYSNHFHKDMLHILDVRWFDGIRIHGGNKAEDTLGCPLVGTTVDGTNRIHGGLEIMPKLFAKVHDAIRRGEEVWIEVKNA